MGSPETRTQSPDYSYETFSNQKFYKDLNMRLLKRAPDVQVMTDFATGTGAIIDHMLELGKLETPFTVLGIDIDETELGIARKKFEDYNLLQGNDVIEFRNTSVLEVPVPDSSQELVTFFNSIHLIDEPDQAIAEAARILVPRGKILINTGYEKDFGYPDKEAQSQWTTLAAMARRILKTKYGYTEFDPPSNYFKNTANDYLRWLEEAGFESTVLRREVVEMDRDAMRAICSYHEFARGSFPNIPVEDSISAFNEAMEPAFERARTDSFRRGWYSFIATKKTV